MIGFLAMIGCLIFLCLFFLIMAIIMNIPAYFDWEDGIITTNTIAMKTLDYELINDYLEEYANDLYPEEREIRDRLFCEIPVEGGEIDVWGNASVIYVRTHGDGYEQPYYHTFRAILHVNVIEYIPINERGQYEEFISLPFDEDKLQEVFDVEC